jgi:hypothetical protein
MDGGACRVKHGCDHRIEQAIMCVDAGDRCLEEFLGLHLAFVHQFGKPKAVIMFVIFHAATVLHKTQRLANKPNLRHGSLLPAMDRAIHPLLLPSRTCRLTADVADS